NACRERGLPRELPLTPETSEALLAHPWTGNVRELKNVLERAVVLAGAEITPEHLGLATGSSPGDAASAVHETARKAGVAEVQRALEQCGGNQTKAARVLGISRRTLTARLGEYGLPRPRK